MNKEYAYIDGKAIIVDEKGEQTKSEYYDNLDEILVQENLIEDMENKIKQLEKDIDAYKEINKKHHFPFMLLAVILAIVLGNLVILSVDPKQFMETVDFSFGKVNLVLLLNSVISTISIPLGAIFDSMFYQQYKDAKNEEKGINSDLDYLKKQIIIEKQKLEKLQKDKKKNEEGKKFGVVVVDDKAKSEELKNNLDFYYNLGYNENKYFKYYQLGRLNDKLQKYYNDTEIKKVEDYLEEKRHTLIKNHNKKIK